jgi:hypothetical protein
MPAPVRYRSTAAVYDDGGAVRGTTRARGSPDAPLPPSSVTGSIVTPGPPLRAVAVNPAFTAASGNGSPINRPRSGAAATPSAVPPALTVNAAPSATQRYMFVRRSYTRAGPYAPPGRSYTCHTTPPKTSVPPIDPRAVQKVSRLRRDSGWSPPSMPSCGGAASGRCSKAGYSLTDTEVQGAPHEAEGGLGPGEGI